MPDGSRSFEGEEGRDPATLADVYRTHAGYVWRVLRHCGVPDSDLDDAVQETFLVVFRRLSEFEARASLRTWIYAVAVRVASTRRRSQRREAARREQAGHRMHGASEADPEAALSKAEAAQLVDRLLDELDASKRTVFVLAELEGVKVPEISRILGVNPRTVHSRLRLARESFGSALKRMQAHEQGNRRVARLRPRPLLEHAANDRPPAARRKAAMAALAVRIEQGAMPGLAGWKTLALGSSGAGAGLPAMVVAAAGVLGVIATAVAVAGGSPARAPAPTRETTSVGARSPGTHAADRGSPVTPNPKPGITPEAPVVRTSSTIGVPSLPLGRPRTATHAGDGPSGRSESAIESMIDRPEGADARSTAALDTPGRRGTAANAPTSHDAAAASTLDAETRLLERAREALRRGDAQAALTALEAHAEIPHGLLLDEARSTRLRALCAAGRASEAAALADAWARGEEGSRWHDVVAAACR